MFTTSRCILILFTSPALWFTTGYAQQFMTGKIEKRGTTEIIIGANIINLKQGKHNTSDLGGNYKIPARIVHLPVDFKTVQDLLLGNPIYLDTTNILFYKKDASGISLLSVGDLFKNYLTLNMDNTLRHCKLDDVDPMRARTCDLTYGDYEQRDTLRFSTYRKISVAEKTKVDIELGFKQYKFNEVLSFSFNIPRNYKRR